MTEPFARRARAPRRPSLARRALPFAAGIVLFAVGVALGDALDDNPKPGGTQTLVRTLTPLPLAPAARETVTVTTSNK